MWGKRQQGGGDGSRLLPVRINLGKVAAADSCETCRTLTMFNGRGYTAKKVWEVAVGSVGDF
jgi:hypothetical protein